MSILKEDSSLEDYARTDYESIEAGSEFSPKFQVFELYKGILSLQVQNQYLQARKMFYDSLGWFAPLFDPIFPERCQLLLERYESPQFRTERNMTYEQVEQLKYMRILSNFTILLIDVTSKSRVEINTNPNTEVELTAVCYPQILNYPMMVTELYVKMNQMQQQKLKRKELETFFNQSLGWFAGIFDSQFLKMGYLIAETEECRETKFRRLLVEFAKLIVRKHVTQSAMAQLVYKPNVNDNVPSSIEDIIKEKKPLLKPKEPMQTSIKGTNKPTTKEQVKKGVD